MINLVNRKPLFRTKVVSWAISLMKTRLNRGTIATNVSESRKKDNCSQGIV